jgi:hypothetical protein
LPFIQASSITSASFGPTFTLAMRPRNVVAAMFALGIALSLSLLGSSHIKAVDEGRGAAIKESYDFTGAKQHSVFRTEIPIDMEATAIGLTSPVTSTLRANGSYKTIAQTTNAPIEKKSQTLHPPSRQELKIPKFPFVLDDKSAVVSYVGTAKMTKLVGQFFRGKLCNTVQGNYTDVKEYNNHSTLVNISFSCAELFQRSGLGSGNFLQAFYGMRMVSHALGTTDVSIKCHDAEETKKSLILPWVTGVFPRLSDAMPANEDVQTYSQVCPDFKSLRIGYRHTDMLFEMRRMAIAMVGIPYPDHPSAAWAEEHLWSEADPHRHGRNYMQLPSPQKGDAPLFPNAELDDAMLHFRCGDLAFSNHPSFGFMKFGSFSRHLSPDVRSIGIATQPFDPSGQRRQAEGGGTAIQRCQLMVEAFVEHLTGLFPKARIRVHNGLDETIALTFARMVMANQTVIPITSFGVFPGVSTFGTGYIRYPDYAKAPNRWLITSPWMEKVDNVKLVKEPVLMAQQLKNMWGQNVSSVINWFANYTS